MSSLVVDMTADVIDLTVEEWSTPAKELEIARPECARLYALNPWFEDGKKQADNNPNFIVNEKDGDHSVQHLYPGWKRAAESLASLSAFGGEEDVELVRKLFAAMGSSGGSSDGRAEEPAVGWRNEHSQRQGYAGQHHRWRRSHSLRGTTTDLSSSLLLLLKR